MNPYNPDHLKRLRSAIRCSRKRLAPFRENRIKAIKEYVGAHYSEDGADDKVPINQIKQAVQIYTRLLAPRAPKMMVGTKVLDLKPRAKKFELGINHLVDEIRFGDTLKRAVLEALFCIGIVKTGLNANGTVEINGYLHDVGQPFADIVTLDDWCHDMTAKRWDQVSFAGNRYRVPLEAAMESELYEKDVREKLKATERRGYEESGEDREEDISQGSSTGMEDEYSDYVELYDIWLPRENMVITFPAEGESDPRDPLRVVEWEGPENGPYRFLEFSEVPGNIMPAAPVNDWIDLHDLTNRLFRKLGRQGERQKTILGIQGPAASDAERVIKASDGDAIRTDNPDKMKEFRFGGIDQSNFAFTVSCMDRFSYLAGNLDSLGGLSAQADTAKQEELIKGSGTTQVEEMKDRTITFAKDVIRDLSWYLWTDPLIELPLTHRVQGTDITINDTFGPTDREGDFLDYNINIEPYSMQHESPQTKMNTLRGVFQEFILPMLPQMQASGIGLNLEGLLKKVGYYTNMDELEELLIFMQPTMPPEQAVQPATPKPATTTRNYTRTSRVGATRAGKDQALISTMMGANPQPKEQAAMMRPVA